MFVCEKDSVRVRVDFKCVKVGGRDRLGVCLSFKLRERERESVSESE